MRVAHFLAVGSLLWSWSALAQAKQAPLDSSRTAPFAQTDLSWSQADGGFQLVPLDANLDKGLVITPNGLAPGDGICYTIRSYVVARDSKDSDAVHPVRYSTCQMGNRYRLKSVHEQPVRSER
jgi:hypothetical protein